MRAAEQAHPSHSHPTTRAYLAHVVLAVLITIVLLWIWHPAVLHAQRVTPRRRPPLLRKAAAAASAHATAGTSGAGHRQEIGATCTGVLGGATCPVYGQRHHPSA
jgi:hypothetical protein